MSSILKALKRLEEDKADRLDAPVDIARDILRQPRKRRRTAPWKLLALVVGGGIALGGGLFLVYQWFSPQASEPVTKVALTVNQPPSPPPLAVELVETRPILPPSIPSEPEIVEVRMAPPPVARPTQTAVRAAAPAAKATASPQKPVPLPSAKAESAATVKPAALPRLAVSGIAFQTEREARLAVVNDLPVMEGTLIEGAQVEEIMADRVRFAWEGKTFEVLLGEKH